MSEPDVPAEAWSGVHRGPLRAGEWVRLTRREGPPPQHLPRARQALLLQPRPSRARRPDRSRGGLHDHLVLGRRVPRLPAAALRVRRLDAARRRGRLPQGRRPDRRARRHLPGRPRRRGRRRLRRADLLAAARGRPARPGVVVRAARGVRRRRPHATSPSSSAAATHPAWSLTLGDLAEALPASGERADRVILDMLAPWECLDAAADALRPGGIVCAYVATTTQLSRFVETRAGARRLHRAAGLGVAGARLARRGPRGAARATR